MMALDMFLCRLKRNMFVNIKPYIAKFLNRPNIIQKLQEQQVKNEWQDIIETFNKSARDKSEALYIKENGELVVKVVNHLWLQEMMFYKKEIEEELTKKYKTVKSLRLVI